MSVERGPGDLDDDGVAAPSAPSEPTTLPAPSAPTTLLRDEAVVAGRLLIIGLAVAAVIWMGLQVQFIAAAVVLGFAQVSLLWPLVRWLRDHGIPQVLAAIFGVLAFLGAFAGVSVVMVNEVVDSTPDLVDAVTGAFDNVSDLVENPPFGLDESAIQDVVEELQTMLGQVLGNVSSAAATGLGIIGNFVTVGLVATFFAIFALTSGDRLWKSFASTLPVDRRRPATAAFRAAMRTTGNWFYASTLTGLVDGVLIGAGLVVLGVPFAIPIGALTFLLAYVPLVGATLAGAVAVLVALFAGGLSTALWALLLVVIVQQVEGNVLSPLLMARALSFHPLVILLLTTSAATAFGLVGLFLAVPLAGAVMAATLAWRASVLGRPVRNPLTT